MVYKTVFVSLAIAVVFVTAEIEIQQKCREKYNIEKEQLEKGAKSLGEELFSKYIGCVINTCLKDLVDGKDCNFHGEENLSEETKREMIACLKGAAHPDDDVQTFKDAKEKKCMGK